MENQSIQPGAYLVTYTSAAQVSRGPNEADLSVLAVEAAPLTAPTLEAASGGRQAMHPDVARINEQAREMGGSAQTHVVTIPLNTHPGMQFTVNDGGQRFMATCPASAGPNMRVRIVPPAVPDQPEAAQTEEFEHVVPPGVVPAQPFALIANGQRVLVTCPPNVVPGELIRFRLPVSHYDVGNIQLDYGSGKGGWKRTIRAADLKFQWVRCENEASNNVAPVDAGDALNSMKPAYVREISFLEGNDARLRTGTISFVPVTQALVDSKLLYNNRTVVRYSDIVTTQKKSLKGKMDWFEHVCGKLTHPREEGHVNIFVRRSQLLLDSVDAIMGLGRDDMRKVWRFRFLDESGIGEGGVARDWFGLVTEQVFDLSFGMWVPSVNNQACMDINPESGFSNPDNHLVYFRFLGRVIGRALFDRQVVKGHMNRMIYKHLLGWPVTYEDISALPQLTELLLGFFDVVPEPALTVFGAHELELTLCGLPTIDLEDWRANTIYMGDFEDEGHNHKVVKWFWEVVEDEFDPEMRARLLQFCTGTSGVPQRGFAYLQGIDGHTKPFTIEGDDYKLSMHPRSRTSLNRIYLPNYKSRKKLMQKLTIAVMNEFDA